MIESSNVDVQAALHAFLLRYLEDRERGTERSLADYQALFPGHEEEIAAKLAALRGERETSTPPDSAAGERTIGRFRIVCELGRGGQGSVYLAEDPKLHRRVALKVLSAWSGLSPEHLRRFRREAESASRLDHPGICSIYEAGEAEGLPYIAMRYVEGESLARKVAAARESSSGLVHMPRGDDSSASTQRTPSTRPRSSKHDDLSTALRFFERAARAMHEAHESGIVHRDVKPGNIMVTPEGAPVLMDFGLAKIEEDTEPTLTQSGEVFGTPAYMSPEQILGRRRRIDRRTDVYSLAVALFECLTLRRPFEATTREGLYRAILEGDAPDPCKLNPGVPSDLGVIVETALQKDPDHRYQTALDFAEELSRVRAHEPIRARPAGPLLRLTRWAQRNPRLASALGGLVLVLALGLAVTGFLLGETRASLGEVARLSDLRALPFLQREAERQLWPAHPETVAAMDVWLGEARELVGRLGEHRAALEELRGEQPADSRTFAGVELGRLESFVHDLEAFESWITEIDERREFASTVSTRSIDQQRDDWGRVTAAIADAERNPRYGGLRIEPQLGLVPLGPDPASGLFEFAHLQTGEVPARDHATGELRIDEASGLIFVLLPSDSFRMGSEAPGPGRPPGTPNVDPELEGRLLVEEMTPVHEVALAPFFLSKYEMTQGQWERITGENPSSYYPGRTHSGLATGVTLRNPVENVSWNRVHEVLRRLDLELPTEAQWEYACRAGTTTPYYRGESTSSLAGHENFADESFAPYWNMGKGYEEGWEDGWLAHAPVGTYLPNAFGLHDMAGNVTEWCRDLWSVDYLRPVDPLTGERDGLQFRFRCFRGGNYYFPGSSGRSAARGGEVPAYRTPRTGVRPARPLSELAAVGPLLAELFDELLLEEDVVAHLEASAELSAERRETALRIVRTLKPTPLEALNDRAWSIVCRSDGSSEDYGLALRLAERAAEERPDVAYVQNTLGAALYRVRRLDEARDTLVRASELNEGSEAPYDRAFDLLFLAMCEHDLEHPEEALRFLEEVQAQWTGADDPELAVLLEEADSIVH